MSNFFKNPHRAQQIKYEPYEPNYRKMNIRPKEVESMTVDSSYSLVAPPSGNNPRERANPNVNNKSYPVGGDPLPNIGNNMEHTWVGINNEIIDDLDIASGHDQSDYDNEDLGLEENKSEYNNEDLNSHSSSLNLSNLGEYSLILFGQLYVSGSLEFIESEIKSLLYGESPICKDVAVTADDLVVLKKVPIKIGIFVEG